MNVSWRTNLWLTPSLIVGGALAVFAVSQRLDWADYTGRLALPKWLDQGSAAANEWVKHPVPLSGIAQQHLVGNLWNKVAPIPA